MSISYSPPVDHLLSLGEPERPWPDYRDLGFTEEHIPELIRVVTDQQLNRADSERPEVWAPMHAWRALGQLQAEAAIEPLISLLRDSAEDDWVLDELPTVFGMIGRAAIPALSQYLADPAHERWTRVSAGDALQDIVEADPTTRDEVVAILMRELQKWWRNDEILNGLLISRLAELDVEAAVPLMEQAFADDRVDTLMSGEWEDVQVQLGLLPEHPTARPQLRLRPFSDFEEEPVRHTGQSQDRQAAKAKTKRKLARQSRKRNRRRK